jgi:hypothetical protein
VAKLEPEIYQDFEQSYTVRFHARYAIDRQGKVVDAPSKNALLSVGE